MAIRYKLSGQDEELFLGLDLKTLVTTRQAAVNATFAGLEGDKHAGFSRKSNNRTPHYEQGTEIRNDRQVSIVSLEELALIASNMRLPKILPEWLGANILIEGIPNMSQLPPSTRFYFSGGAVLVIQAENLPCVNPGKVIQDQFHREGIQEIFPSTALHLRGLVAIVEKPGIIQEGEAFCAEIPEQTIYTPGLPDLS